jgi:glyoxylase-like metal-dependent hydrolase (beta-lactamase superfamily II)
VSDTYELFAIRYGHHHRTATHNFLGGDPHDGPMPLDYFVWAIVGKKRSFVFDTGFDAPRGEKRQRTLLRPVGEGLKMIGINPDSVEDVIISHMHFDHSGNHSLFPKARYHLQDTEMKYCTGRCMCHQALRIPFEVDDVTAML